MSGKTIMVVLEATRMELMSVYLENIPPQSSAARIKGEEPKAQ